MPGTKDVLSTCWRCKWRMGAFLRLLRDVVLINNDVLSGRRLMLWFLPKPFGTGPKTKSLIWGPRTKLTKGQGPWFQKYVYTNLPLIWRKSTGCGWEWGPWAQGHLYWPHPFLASSELDLLSPVASLLLGSGRSGLDGVKTSFADLIYRPHGTDLVPRSTWFSLLLSAESFNVLQLW